MFHILRRYTGLCIQYACYQAECEHRPFTWLDTRSVCTFKCRCILHEINSPTAHVTYAQAYEEGSSAAEMIHEVRAQGIDVDLDATCPFSTPLLRYAWQSGAAEALNELAQPNFYIAD